MKTVYYNGTVYTGALPLVQAFVEEDGRFVFAERMRKPGWQQGNRRSLSIWKADLYAVDLMIAICICWALAVR